MNDYLLVDLFWRLNKCSPAQIISPVKLTREQLQFLNHSNGIAGDYFPNDQNEDGPHIARYVQRCSQLPLAAQVVFLRQAVCSSVNRCR